MRKPRVGEVVEIVGQTVLDLGTDAGKVVSVHDSLDEWWPDNGEDKMGLMDYLAEAPEIAERAEWYVVLEIDVRSAVLDAGVSTTIALASPEVIVR
jgi:hypothetical protein